MITISNFFIGSTPIIPTAGDPQIESKFFFCSAFWGTLSELNRQGDSPPFGQTFLLERVESSLWFLFLEGA